MSSLWTPGGEHPVEPDAAPSDPTGPQMDPEADPLAGLSDEERAQAEAMAAEMAAARQRVLEAPADMVVANHAMGLYELAALHLMQPEPRLAEASLAIDALGVLVGGLQGRLGDEEGTVRDALMQLRAAYLEVRARQPGDPGSADT